MTGFPTPARRAAAGRLGAVEAAPAIAESDDDALAGPHWGRRYRDRLRLTDSTIVVIAILAAVAARRAFVNPAVMAQESTLVTIGMPVLMATIWLLALTAFKTRDLHLIGVGSLEYKRVLNATATAFGVVASVLLLAQTSNARWYLIVAAPIGMGGLLIGRWAWRRWLFAQRRDGRFLSRAIVVGSRDDVEYVARQIQHDAGAGFKVIGAAIDGEDGAELDISGQRVPIVSEVDDVAAAAARHRADSVIVTGRYGGHEDEIRQLSWSLEGAATELVLSSRLTDVAGPRIHFRPVEGLPLLHVEIPTFEGMRHVVKRTFDIVFAGSALILLSPLLLVIAVLVKLDSPGPVIFRQMRCGKGGLPFEMLKFRSMVATAEQELAGLLQENEGAGALFKLRNDPRVTRLGRLLRMHSLDELPQFWNILVGDMSVVGPRPPLLSEAECYEAEVKRRLMIKPGLTGLWQISGRSDLSWEESVRLDLYYVENWSIMSDLMIVWRTIKTIFKPEGAY